MSERQSSGAERFLNRLKDTFKPAPERKRDKESLRLASEAVLLFANSEGQEPLSTFLADSPSILDLRQLNPGAIIRVEEAGHLVPNYYHWLVLGIIDDKGVDIFSIDHKDRERPILAFQSKLKLSRSWCLIKRRPSATVFKIKDSIKAIYAMQADPFDGLYAVEKVDIMSGGTKSKATEKLLNEISQGKPLVAHPSAV